MATLGTKPNKTTGPATREHTTVNQETLRRWAQYVSLKSGQQTQLLYGYVRPIGDKGDIGTQSSGQRQSRKKDNAFKII